MVGVQFVLKLNGYNDYSTTVVVSPGSAQTLSASLTQAIFGRVSIMSMPGASIFMDGNPAGSIGPDGKFSIGNVPSGNHVFKLTANGYNDWINTVYVQPNELTSISATLTPAGPNPIPLAATGGLKIASSPAGAEVFVDNIYRGYTPSDLSGISSGDHTILLKYTWYVDYSSTA